MKKISVKIFDQSDDDFADALVDLGLKRSVAKVLTVLKNAGEVSSRDLELGSDMRQPEVSTAMKELKDYGWVIEQDEKKSGKGRPSKVYKMIVNVSEILEHLENQKKIESQKMMDEIQKLKELIN